MDLNYYLHREQVERMRADAAHNAAAKAAHVQLAELYRERIEDYRSLRADPRSAPRPHLIRS